MTKHLSKTIQFLIIPFGVSLFFILMFLIPGFRTIEYRFSDLLLRLKPAVKERDDILLMDIDDLAIIQVGIWPWSRDVTADGLILLAELNAAYSIFDIEYVDKSPRGVNNTYLEETLPTEIHTQYTDLEKNTRDLFSALIQGYIPLKEADSYVQDLSSMIRNQEQSQLEALNHIARDNDSYYGAAARLNGSAFFTVRMLEDEIQLVDADQELLEYTEEHIGLTAERGEKPGIIPRARTIQPAILPILKKAKGAGFPNVIVDYDGVRRRINLFYDYNGKLYPQLAMAPVLDYLGNPEIELSGTNVILKGAKKPSGEIGDITIPLNSKGQLLINWPKKTFLKSFRHLSFNELYIHDRYLENIIANLQIMNEAGYLTFHPGDHSPLDLYNYTEMLKDEILNETRDPSEMEEYRQVRDLFFQQMDILLNGQAEQQLNQRLQEIIQQPDLDEQSRNAYIEIQQDAASAFSILTQDFNDLKETRTLLKENVEGSFVIIGHTGISTSDIGVNPFEKAYMNVGTHAAIINSILNEDFIKDSPAFLILGLAALIALGATLLIRNQPPDKTILIGMVITLIFSGASMAFSLLTQIFLPVLLPFLTVALSVLGVSVFKFILSENEKGYLRNAFSRYLSDDVIKDLLNNPDRLTLGGEQKNLTAIFTDIKGFSTISEHHDPKQLVNILNQYLSEMSDIILEEKGTIDKYEGDAIISFFGAPMDVEDHPLRACVSAVRMKRAEKLLNERLMANGTIKSPLLTRIGVNSGDMVVGNMGTAKKMDYTIMGNAVNLAARLEGVNKQYGTWILASEQVIKETGSTLITRKLDRVRVLGINTPVRLFEILEIQGHGDADLLKTLEIFHKGLEAFENKQWKEAEELFMKALTIRPGDGPSETFLSRARKFKQKPPTANWDGVFNMAVK